jgi:hypothetical protein
VGEGRRGDGEQQREQERAGNACSPSPGPPTKSSKLLRVRSGISVCATRPRGTVSSFITPYSSGHCPAGGRAKVPISMSTRGRWMA